MKFSVLHRSSRLLRALSATPGGAGEAQGPPTSIILPDSQRSSRFQRSRRIAGSPGLRPRTGRLQMGEAQHGALLCTYTTAPEEHRRSTGESHAQRSGHTPGVRLLPERGSMSIAKGKRERKLF
jgi:hypothetical protein